MWFYKRSWQWHLHRPFFSKPRYGIIMMFEATITFATSAGGDGLTFTRTVQSPIGNRWLTKRDCLTEKHVWCTYPVAFLVMQTADTRHWKMIGFDLMICLVRGLWAFLLTKFIKVNHHLVKLSLTFKRVAVINFFGKMSTGVSGVWVSTNTCCSRCQQKYLYDMSSVD